MNSPPAASRTTSVRDIESALRRLRGVVAARIVVSDQGAIEEIHAITDTSRAAKMVVRDIESVLLAQWNLTPDRNKISVAQLQPNQAPILRTAPPRLQLVAASTDQKNGELSARVTLRGGGGGNATTTEFSGQAQSSVAESADSNTSLRLVAEATLRAVEFSCGRSGVASGAPLLTLRTLQMSDMDGRSVVVALVALQGGRGKSEDLLTGSALVRTDALRAVVAATLDAVNRRLSALEAMAVAAAAAAAQQQQP